MSFLVSLALSVLELKKKQSLLPATHISPPGHRHNDVNVATEDNCNVIRYELDKQQNPCNHNALAVLTCRSSLLPENNPRIEPATPISENPDSHAENDEIGHETAEISKN